MFQDTDFMYVVIGTKALAVDYSGTAIICDVVEENDIEYVDWDSADPIDWMDLLPTQYEVYKNTIDFITSNIQHSVFVK